MTQPVSASGSTPVMPSQPLRTADGLDEGEPTNSPTGPPPSAPGTPANIEERRRQTSELAGQAWESARDLAAEEWGQVTRPVRSVVDGASQQVQEQWTTAVDVTRSDTRSIQVMSLLAAGGGGVATYMLASILKVKAPAALGLAALGAALTYGGLTLWRAQEHRPADPRPSEDRSSEPGAQPDPDAEANPGPIDPDSGEPPPGRDAGSVPPTPGRDEMPPEEVPEPPPSRDASSLPPTPGRGEMPPEEVDGHAPTPPTFVPHEPTDPPSTAPTTPPRADVGVSRIREIFDTVLAVENAFDSDAIEEEALRLAFDSKRPALDIATMLQGIDAAFTSDGRELAAFTAGVADRSRSGDDVAKLAEAVDAALTDEDLQLKVLTAVIGSAMQVADAVNLIAIADQSYPDDAIAATMLMHMITPRAATTDAP